MRTAFGAAAAGLVGLVIGVGVGAVGGAAFGLDRWFEEQRRPEDLRSVVVAVRELPAGHVIVDDDLFAVQLAPRFVPDSAVLDTPSAVGRVVVEDILANEPLREERLRPR
ncbi:MAG: SAF domain-containing protein [Myxococcota bacterium]